MTDFVSLLARHKGWVGTPTTIKYERDGKTTTLPSVFHTLEIRCLFGPVEYKIHLDAEGTSAHSNLLSWSENVDPKISVGRTADGLAKYLTENRENVTRTFVHLFFKKAPRESIEDPDDPAFDIVRARGVSRWEVSNDLVTSLCKDCKGDVVAVLFTEDDLRVQIEILNTYH